MTVFAVTFVLLVSSSASLLYVPITVVASSNQNGTNPTDQSASPSDVSPAQSSEHQAPKQFVQKSECPPGQVREVSQHNGITSVSCFKPVCPGGQTPQVASDGSGFGCVGPLVRNCPLGQHWDPKRMKCV